MTFGSLFAGIGGLDLGLERAGIDGKRSGLWSEFARIVGELRPRYVLVENVAALLSRGMGRVLGDLAALGFDAEWTTLSACSLGAPHTRERLFVLAYPEKGRRICMPINMENPEEMQLEKRRVWQRTPEPFPRNLGFRPDSDDRRMDDGFPDWVDRIGAIGNAVVPQVAEWIGRRILEGVV